MEIPEEIKMLKEVNKYLRNVPVRYNLLFDEVGEYDKETCDCLHDIEFTKFYRTGGHQRARHLKEVRQGRRRCKDEMELLAPLKEYLEDHPHLVDELSQVIGKINSIQEKQAVRVYKPRIEANADKFNGQHFDLDKSILAAANTPLVKKKLPKLKMPPRKSANSYM